MRPAPDQQAHGIERLDFVKVEAEGVELEVLEGDAKPRKLAIPRIIYSLWLQGLNEAPPLVKLNLDRWMQLNPGYEMRVLTRREVDEMLAPEGLATSGLAPQALSDIVRMRLLSEGGGIWADASVYPVQPVDDWLGDCVNQGGFFAFERPGWDRPISSWFLAATPAHPVIGKWWAEVRRFWSRPRVLLEGIPAAPAASVSPSVGGTSETYPYFWLHYLFAYLLESDAEFGQLWGKCTKLPADAPHRMQELFARRTAPSYSEIRACLASAPVQKLNWRTAYPALEHFERGQRHLREGRSAEPLVDRVGLKERFLRLLTRQRN